MVFSEIAWNRSFKINIIYFVIFSIDKMFVTITKYPISEILSSEKKSCIKELNKKKVISKKLHIQVHNKVYIVPNMWYVDERSMCYLCLYLCIFLSLCIYIYIYIHRHRYMRILPLQTCKNHFAFDYGVIQTIYDCFCPHCLNRLPVGSRKNRNFISK